MNDLRFRVDPHDRSAQGRMFRRDLLAVQDCLVGDVYMVCKCCIGKNPGVSFFGGLADEA
jgi:hypothetical protein